MSILGQISKIESTRKITKINTDWLFVKNNIEAVKEMSFNNTLSLNLPHNWGVQQAQKGDKNFYKGIGWYKKKSTLFL